MFKLFIKDLKLFIYDKRSTLLTFLLPIVLITLFAFAFGAMGKNDAQSKPKNLLVADLDQTVASKKIIQKLDSVKGLRMVAVDLDKAKELVIKGKYPGVLIFHKGYADSLSEGIDAPLELMYDKAREMEIGMLQPVLISNIMESVGKETVSKHINKYLDNNFPHLDKGITNKIINDAVSEGENSPSIDIDSAVTLTSIVGEKKESNLALVQAVAGTAIMMLLFSVAGLGTSILEEKENGTIHRLFYSPLKGSSILYGKMLIAFFVSLIQLMVMFVYAWLVFGLDIFTNIPALIMMIIATGFAISSFGVFLAAISKTRQQAQGLSTIIILVMSAIGGSMVPLFIMPEIMQTIGMISLNYWGIQGFYDIFWRDLPTADIFPRILVLLGIGLVMTFISIRLFKKSILKIV